MTKTIRVREARIDDVPAILALMKGLAAFENLSSSIQTDEARLRADGFGDDPRFSVLLAETEDGRPAGFLSTMVRYSIWGGGEFINLDDLFVAPHARGRGVARALMRRLAQIAAGKGLMVRWEVLPDNEPAKALYTALGATLSDKLIARWPVEAALAFAAQAPAEAIPALREAG